MDVTETDWSDSDETLVKKFYLMIKTWLGLKEAPQEGFLLYILLEGKFILLV